MNFNEYQQRAAKLAIYNIAKLESRKERGTLAGDGDNR